MAEKSPPLKSKSGPRKCEACAITLPDIYAYADHLESKEHIKGVMKRKYGEKYLEAKANLVGKKVEKDMKSDDDKTGSSDDEGNVYTCEVCQKICTGMLNYKLHLSGKSHEKKVKKERLLKQMKEAKLIQEDNNLEEENSLINGLFTTNQFSSSDILCKVCNKKCNGPEAFKQHNKSESHKKKLAIQDLMKDTGHRKDSSGNQESDEVIRCDVCSKGFSGPLPYRQHMESASHLKQVKLTGHLEKFKDLVVSSEDNNQIKCKECNKCFSGPKPFNDHLKSASHSKLKHKKDLKSKLMEKYPEMVVMQSNSISDSEDSEREDTFLCRVCHIALSGPESARDHFQSQKHKKVIKEKMRYEKYKRLKNGKKSNTESKSEDENQVDEYKDESSDGFDIIE